MQKILAISGGIDSVSLLHMLRSDPDVIVAHFNPGVRVDSDLDAAFVQQLAKRYHLPFKSKKDLLGPSCSEAHARSRRYTFLNQLCAKHNGKIYTAHHQDDLLESIAINLIRGTGWRGLVPFSDPNIERPLLHLTKKDIYRYASQHGLTFRQDSTNTADSYLRNRVRNLLSNLDPAVRSQIFELYFKQKDLKSEIDNIIEKLLPDNNVYPRSWFVDLDDNIAIEILRAGLAKIGLSATRPQLTDFLSALRTYAPQKKFNLSHDRLVTISRDQVNML